MMTRPPEKLLLLTCCALLIVAGCKPSDSPAPEPTTAPAQPSTALKPLTNPSASTPTITAPKPTPSATPTTPPPAPRAADATGGSPQMAALFSQINGSPTVKDDPILASITKQMATTTSAMTLAVPGNTNVQDSIETVLKALAENQDNQALQAYRKLRAASLTPEQARITKQVQDALSAYVVQKNFKELPGAGNEVTQIVTAFRQGDSTTAIQALRKVSMNAQFSPAQTTLLHELVDQYLPGLKDAARGVQSGLQGVNPIQNK